MIDEGTKRSAAADGPRTTEVPLPIANLPVCGGPIEGGTEGNTASPTGGDGFLGTHGRARVGHATRARASKKGIKQRLPAAARKELEKEIVSATEVTVAWLEQLDEKFGLGRIYAVTRRGLRDLVIRVRIRHGKEVKSLRDRQEWAGKVLKEMVGEKGKDNPQLLGQHAYLAMVAVLFERLTTHGKDISTEELAALSKMLAEQRRAEAQSSRGSHDEDAQAVKGEGELPEDFGEVVKQIYGTNFQGSR